MTRILFVFIILGIGLSSFAAWVTAVYQALIAGNWILMTVEIAIAPVGTILGWAHWLGLGGF